MARIINKMSEQTNIILFANNKITMFDTIKVFGKSTTAYSEKNYYFIC